MCRMLAVAGRFDVPALVDGLRAMASNSNPPHAHEYTKQGRSYVHGDGWGAAWEESGRLAIVRGLKPCFDDAALDHLGAPSVGRLLLHARKGTGNAGVESNNTHPFTAELDGLTWAFCHNGSIRDTSSLRVLPGVVPAGGTDSERLFHHVLSSLDVDDPTGSFLSSLDAVEDFTCVNSVLFSPAHLYYATRAEPGTERPRYYTLWVGSGKDLSVVSSEPIEALDVTWEPLRHGSGELLR